MPNLLQIVPCARCQKSCLIRAPYEPGVNYGLPELRPTRQARGLCEECAAHWWLYSVDGFRWALQDCGPEFLSLETVQAALGSVLGMMHPVLGCLDWGCMIGQWDLPWPDDWRLPNDG